MIRIRPRTPLTLPDVPGVYTDGEVWELDPVRYETFLAEVAGVDAGAALSATDCYRVGNRIEAVVSEHRRDGEWTAEVADRYPDVTSRDEILALARFFRECHACRQPGCD